MQKRARRHNKEGGNHLEQESNRQKAMEDINRGLHPAVDGQSLGEGVKVKAATSTPRDRDMAPAMACQSPRKDNFDCLHPHQPTAKSMNENSWTSTTQRRSFCSG